MRWGTPKEYAWLWKVSGDQYRNQLVFWLGEEKPELKVQVMREIERGNRKGNSDSVTPKGQALE